MQITSAVSPSPVADGHRVYQRYLADFNSLPGVVWVGWFKHTPDQIGIRFATDGFRRLADNVLRDAVEGVRLVLETADTAPAPVPGADLWADNPLEMARAVASMPGVAHVRASREHGIRSYTMVSFEPGVAERLTPLVSPSFGDWRVQFLNRSLPKPQ